MPRRPRIATGGYVYHVLNRGVGRMTLFEDDPDYAAFLRVLAEACERVQRDVAHLVEILSRVLAEACERVPGVRLLGYCVMPNHWHLVLWRIKGGE